MNLLLLVWYIFQGYKNVIHADSASRVLLAHEIFDTGSLFPAEWVYVNGDILALSTHLAIVPFLGLLPAGFQVHALSSLLFSALVLHGAWLVTGTLSLSRERRMLILAVLAAGLSSVSVEFVFGQLTYGVILGTCFYLAFLAYRVTIEESVKTRRLYGALLASLCFAACLSNPKRAAVYYFIPLFAALAFHAFNASRQGMQSTVRAVGRTTLLALLGAMTGAILYALLLPSLLNVQGAGNVRLLPPQDIAGSLGLLWREYVEAVVGRVAAGTLVASVAGIAFTAKLLVALLLLWFVPRACGKHLEKPLSAAAFMTTFAVTLVLLSVFFQLMTSLAGSGRYLLPGLIFLLMVGLAVPVDLRLTPGRTSTVVLIFLCFIGTSWSTLYADVKSPENLRNRRDQKALQLFLLDRGLKYGYASYWNAAPHSVLSDGQLLVRQITVFDALPIPAPWISSMRWYRADAWSGPTFLMLTPEESRTVNWAEMARRGAAPSSQLAFGGFEIRVFNDNLATRGLPGWPAPWALIQSPRVAPAVPTN